jgi:hypothetical protein
MRLYVVQVITVRGELLYATRPLPHGLALSVRAEIGDAVRGMSDLSYRVLPPFLTMADRQGQDGLDRARP